jgi:hypothetical protein
MNHNHEASDADQSTPVRPLLEFLMTKTDKRYPRLNAFCDLMARGKNAPVTIRMQKSNVALATGQFITSISELADTWQWQRTTVRVFLNGLAALGYLRMMPCGKYYLFTVTV